MAPSVALILALSLLGSNADDDKARAVSLLEEGNKAFLEARFVDALDRYEEAYRTFPSAKLLFSIASAKERLGDRPGAANAFVRFLREAQDVERHDVRVEAERRLKSLDASLAQLTIRSSGDALAIVLDGQAIGRTPIVDLRIWPGEHRLVASGDAGGARIEEALKAIASQSIERTLAPGGAADAAGAAEAAAASEAAAAAAEEIPRVPTPPAEDPIRVRTEASGAPAEDAPSLAERWWFWALLAAAAAGAGIGVYAAIHKTPYRLDADLGSSDLKTWMRVP